MKFNLNISKDTLTHLLKQKKSGDRSMFHPTRDWLILLVVCTLLGIGSVAYHITLFITSNEVHEATPTATATPAEINRNKLDTTLANIRLRSNNFSGGASSSPTLPDPSK